MSYRCPFCGMISYNRNDELHSYCGACHHFATDADAVKAYVNGYAARVCGDPISACPYPIESPALQSAWGAGWRHGDEGINPDIGGPEVVRSVRRQ